MKSRRCILFCVVFGFMSMGFAADTKFITIPDSTYKRKDNSGNTQTITVSSFQIADSLVTVKEWKYFLNDLYPLSISDWQSRMQYLTDSDYKEMSISDNWPTFILTWYQVVEYCNWRSIKDGLKPVYTYAKNKKGLFDTCNWDKNANGYRLPTEAEWELSSGIVTAYATEKDYILNTWVPLKIDIHGTPHDIKQKTPNRFGLYDAFGIVSQYCWDYYDERYFLSKEVINPSGPTKAYASNGDHLEHVLRVARGSWWTTTAHEIVTQPRFYGYAEANNQGIGFRLAKN